MNRGMTEGADVRFRQAAALLPSRLRQAAERLSREQQRQVEELRLRNGYPITVSGPEGEQVIPGCEQQPLTERDLAQVLEIATQASAHTVLEQVRNGFVTVKGGHRIGICGSGVVRDGEVCNLRRLSSLSIRVARSLPGIAARILDGLTVNGVLQSTLILSPPGGGKTTLLRDIIRAVSDGDGVTPMRVGIADERGELAAMYDGIPQLNVGRRTDVLDGCPKGTALLMLLRGMNPQVLAADEITAPADCAALEAAANCGVTLLATAHASSGGDLCARPLYRHLLEAGIFRRAVLIQGGGKERTYQVKRLEGGAVC
ncbi:stage III sporulation protein AB [uncultured Pseudoflavonifractor sp.]|uniref:stage III sporulation protein AB n=1 Tax=uncultured Pseudoflavonifractor sp. TaxID=1221379 RepID=UPI0025EC761C|nr:stage III sporulation protein AB [uncultured Pseudoflavonifractor sp.]